MTLRIKAETKCVKAGKRERGYLLSYLAVVVLVSLFCISLHTSPIHADEEQDTTVSVTIGIPSSATPSPTPSPPASPIPGPSVSPIPVSPTPISPTPIPGFPEFKIFGYGPLNSEVYLSGIAVSEQTFTEDDGYFEFNRLFFPTFLSFLSGYKYPELCLFAKDDTDRLTSSVCIPPLPLYAETKAVGPILLSPTFEIEKGNIQAGEQTKASGKTLPNAEVNIFLAREKQGLSIFSLVKEALAYYIPTYHITSDSQGYFEYNLPDNPDTWRMFASASIQGAPSAKSNTLTFVVWPSYLNFLLKIIEFVKKIFLVIKPDWLYILIMIQIVIICYLLHIIHRSPKTAKRVRHIKSTSYRDIISEYKNILQKTQMKNL